MSAPPTQHLFAVSLCVGIALANAWRPGVVAAFAAAALVGVAAARSCGRVRLALVAIALAAVGAGWGSARLDALDRTFLGQHVGRAERSLVVTTGPVRRTPFGLRVPARVERFGALWVDEAVLLELPLGRAPPQGSRLDLVGVVERPEQSSEGFDEREWLRRKGVHVVVRARRWSIVGRRGGILGLADRLHARLDATIAPGLEGERRAILRGIVLGEDEGLTPELRDAFRASGLYHLLAVSGQNVALLVGGVMGLAWLVGIPRLPAQVGALVAIAAYVLAVGWQPSVVRAGVAGGLASLAWLTARQRDRWWFLLVGALVLLAWNPYAALEPGFQLSFGAVAAIFLAVPRFARVFEGYPMPSSLRDVLAVSSACGLATAPISWLHFGAVPLYTVPANALAAPVVGSLLGLGLVAAALDPFAPGAAALVAWANGWCASYLAWCARAVASLPSAQLGTARSLLAVGVVLLLPVVWPRLHRPRAARAGALAVMVLAANVAWREAPRPSPPPPPDGLRVTFLDVGQGDATLIEVPEGAILIDEGPPEADVAGQLRSLGVRALAVLLLTHPSRDNIGGAHDVIREIDVATVFEPRLPFENPFGAQVLAEARARGIRVVVTRAGQQIVLGRLRLSVLWPPDGEKRSSDANDHATVLHLSYGEFDALLPADAESNVTLPLAVRAELYKVAHHGSRDPGVEELLDRVRPRVAVISLGEDNDYGHPAPSLVSALRAFDGLDVFRTDRDGRIVLESDGRRFWVRSER